MVAGSTDDHLPHNFDTIHRQKTRSNTLMSSEMGQTLPFLLRLLLLSLPLTQGAIFTGKQTIQLQKFVQTVMRCRKIPGLSIAIVRGEERWTEGYGVADMSSGRAVTSSTLFGVGSITKAFTVSMLSMLLNESSSFSWETPVTAILGPDFRLGDDYVTDHVTLKDLLTHRTGLSASSLEIFTGVPNNMTLERYEKKIRYLPIASPFRDRHVYNDFMYVLAGRVTEALGGAPWEDLLRVRMLQPMNMKDTKLFDPALVRHGDGLATSYMECGQQLLAVDTSVYTDCTPYRSSGGLLSSADDMTHWMHVLLHQGVTKDGRQIVSEDNIRTMQAAKAIPPENTIHFLYRPEFPETYSDIGYGFAWYTGQYRGYSLVHHPGGVHGFTSLLVFLHDLDLGVFIATNGPGYDQAFKAVNAILFHVTDLVLGQRPWLGPGNVCGFLDHWANVSSLWYSPAAYPGTVLGDSAWREVNADAYLGSYGHRLVGDLIISKDTTGQGQGQSQGQGQGLLMKLNSLQGRLYRTANDSVLVAQTLGVRRFMSMGVDGTPLYMVLKFLSPEADGRYQDLLFTFPGDSQEWTFRRGVRFDSDL